MGAASPGPAPGAAPGAVAAAAPAAGVPSGSTQLEPSSDAGVEEEQPAGEAGGAGGSGRKSRLVWTQELHNRFINALSHLGLKNAVPKSILALMNVEGMTRENVASHLQKYRLYLRRLGGLSDRDRVDADALQRLHEQNVQQMAAQQVLQHSLAAMQGPHPGVLAAMGIGLGDRPQLTVSTSSGPAAAAAAAAAPPLTAAAAPATPTDRQ
ncbi:hypothetical protein COHA_004009 [Chlorella ohadii]|uniref:HTH myb-type domain-containing protein n=1 Tax=Chlorella ohadii TaxID=2649997 RepID=A0AAD5DUK0_9CHLO|nr:hypothetical protein COHA_004009 [Chlorella ohadii]